jgi:hypothetical protein
MSEVLLLLIIITAGTSGELCVARAMRHAGEITDFRPSAVLRVFGDALRLGWLWLGVALLIAYFLALRQDLQRHTGVVPERRRLGEPLHRKMRPCLCGRFTHVSLLCPYGDDAQPRGSTGPNPWGRLS